MGAVPPPVPSDLVADAQLRWPGTDAVIAAGSTSGCPMLLLVPKGTDVRGSQGFGNATGELDLIEVPAGTGRFYTALGVDDVSKGFTNEHRFVVMSQISSPMPIP